MDGNHPHVKNEAPWIFFTDVASQYFSVAGRRFIYMFPQMVIRSSLFSFDALDGLCYAFWPLN